MIKSILFVCLGNICRSPMAETIMRELILERGMADQVMVDSAGIANYHEGERADSRMRSHAADHGYDILHRSRPVLEEDFYKFDLIVGMDSSNVRDLEYKRPADSESRIEMVAKYVTPPQPCPDPYYGGAEGFEFVITLLEEACENILKHEIL
ncbi:MAG: low molecular weight phosphotyrosine protein phosphatase [Marinilabiliaceae bacterium]|nr:low molecular weight phosphotyrosine protein phosphatase [Marinilabiliaceae bacterium]